MSEDPILIWGAGAVGTGPRRTPHGAAAAGVIEEGAAAQPAPKPAFHPGVMPIGSAGSGEAGIGMEVANNPVHVWTGHQGAEA